MIAWVLALGLVSSVQCKTLLWKAYDRVAHKELYPFILQPEDLAEVVRMPERLDGLVALLYQAPDLRVFGIADPELQGISQIEIWGFDEFPTRLARFNLAPSKSAGDGFLKSSDDLLRIALEKNPGLTRLLTQTSALEEKIPYDFARHKKELLKKHFDDLENRGKKPLSWKQVYARVYRERFMQQLKIEAMSRSSTFAEGLSAKAQKGAVPFPIGAEKGKIEFAGYLPSKQKAVAVLETFPSHDGLKLQIFLNQRFRDASDAFDSIAVNPNPRPVFDSAFATLGDRIRLEGRFDLSLLGIPKDQLILVEPESWHQLNSYESLRRDMEKAGVSPDRFDWLNQGDPRLLKSQIMVFDSEENLPQGLDYNRLDPATFLPID